MDVKPNKNASNHIWIEPTVPFIPEDIEIDPTQIVPGLKGTVNHTVKHLNNSHFRFHDVSGCSSKIYEIETYLARTVSIDLYTLQESDDDEANYCIDKNGNGIPWESGDVDGSLLKSCKVTDKIMSTDHVCINSGPDGSIDLYAYHTSANWIHPLDAIVGKGHHSAKVIASTDLECQTIPNRIVPGDPSTYPPRLDPVPTGINVAKLQQDLNTIYKKLGISVNVNYHGVISANFDSFLDDNILTGKQEQARYHIQNFGGIPKAGNSVAWIVNDLYKEADTGGKNKFRSRGRGTGFKDNTLTLNYSILVDRTFSHELGHAKFDLGHPDDDHAHDGLENSHSGDNYNFMNSGKIYSSSVHNISLHRLRQYQWEKIFSNL